MNFFRSEYERYDKRFQKVRDNPNPELMQSNKLLYELWRDQFKHYIKLQEQGKPFAYCQGTSLRPFIAMGIEPLMIAEIADRVRGNEVIKLFEKARSLGFPEDTCDWAQTSLGLFLSGKLPQPVFAYTEAAECNIYVQQMFVAALYLNVPLYTIDAPLDLELESIEYIAGQLAEMIDDIESKVPGTKYDESKHWELLETDKIIQDLLDEIVALASTTPTPIATRDMFRMPPFCLYDPRLPDYYRQFRDELQARVKAGYNAYPGEKYRIIWLGELFNYADPFSILEKDGLICPVYEEGPGISSGRRIMEFDKQYGKKLSPLEEEARAFASAHWGGPVEWRLNDALKWATIFRADGAIHMTQPGCSTCAGSAQIMAEQLESKLGIPTLIIEGHIQDFKKYNQAEVENKLEDFKDMLIQRKGSAKII